MRLESEFCGRKKFSCWVIYFICISNVRKCLGVGLILTKFCGNGLQDFYVVLLNFVVFLSACGG